MEYVIGSIAILAILIIAVFIPFTLGLFRRPTAQTNYYLIHWEEAVHMSDREKRNEGKKVVTNRPRLNERKAAREAQELTDDALADALERWRGEPDHV